MRYLLFLALTLAACTSNERELRIYAWGDYFDPTILHEFEKRYHCRVVIDTYDSNEAMYAKLKLGASGYDLLFPSNYFMSLLQQQNMLQPIDKARIPNLAGIDHRFLQMISVEETSYGVPYLITYTALGYRKDRIKDIQPSWTLFGNKSWRGRMTMVNDMREVLGAALLSLGYSINTSNPEEIEAAIQHLIVWKKNLAKFESEQYKNGLASAEFILSQGYTGDIVQVMQEEEEVGLALPEEGLMISIDFVAIPLEAPHPELASAFINFLYEPRISARNIERTFYLVPNTQAYALLENSLRQNPGIFPPDSILQKSEVIRDIGPTIRLYNKAWSRIKAAD